MIKKSFSKILEISFGANSQPFVLLSPLTKGTLTYFIRSPPNSIADELGSCIANFLSLMKRVYDFSLNKKRKNVFKIN